MGQAARSASLGEPRWQDRRHSRGFRSLPFCFRHFLKAAIRFGGDRTRSMSLKSHDPTLQMAKQRAAKMQAFMEEPCSHQERSDRVPSPAEIKALMKKPIGRDATAALLQALSTFEHGDHIEVQLKDGPKVSVVKASGDRNTFSAR